MRVGFVGVGKLGLDCSTEMMAAGHTVKGYDVVPVNAPFPMTSLQEIGETSEIIFVAVPTPHSPEYGGESPSSALPVKDFDYSIVEQVLTDLNQWCKQGTLVVLISTVLPGTVRRRFVPLVHNYRFIYNPYLIAMGSTAWDMINPEMVIIGTEDGSVTGDAKLLVDFYKTMMKNDPRYEIGTWEEAECIKIFYNTFISTKITLVNMIQDVAESIGNINCDVVASALAKSNMRIMSPAFMKPGMGDAGACHPRDNIALSWMAEEYNLGYDIFATIMHAREQQACNIADFLIKLHLATGLPVYIHGKAYKPGVSYTNGSYSLLIGHFLEELEVSPFYLDPLTEQVQPGSVKGIVFMAHHAPTTYSHSHVIGSEKQAFYTTIESGSVVVDPWRYLTQADVPGSTLIRYGDTRKSA